MTKNIFLTTSILAILHFGSGQTYAGTNIWGLGNVPQVNSKSSAPYTVYVGSYVNKTNALKAQSKLQAKGYNAQIKRKKNLYVVYVGPFNTLQEVHQLAASTPNHPQATRIKNTKFNSIDTSSPKTAYPNKKQIEQISQSNQYDFKDRTKKKIKCKDCQLERDHWFVQLQGGIVFPLNENNILVDNGSNFPSPANVDAYSVKQSNQGTIALTVGDRITTHSSFINHYTLSGRLQYVFPTDVGNTIMQYSLPEFLNYNYDWKLSTLALTADTKLNLFHFSTFSPYVNGGLGVSFNEARSFNETALPGVTARISPAYSDHTLTQFTYHVGAGIDFSFIPNWLLSAGYEFESFGDFSSGKGQSTWSGESLRLGSYQANTLLFGVTYLIN
ncbi:Sporulation related domain protein [Legionella gratiana]|uniref:Opacity protein and related surface antigens n=1 Tax=Legionella gratiana TaxID=45066 RepID=A0A378IZ61_9GAMM|nr:SPOR domain-containing protein [Legionella gratiana]KTD11736.1 Sporulation related domain protein [Legionella gratiana]STX40753.1 Opacity protein and related surface antigens [Legionella gratiana]